MCARVCFSSCPFFFPSPISTNCSFILSRTLHPRLHTDPQYQTRIETKCWKLLMKFARHPFCLPRPCYKAVDERWLDGSQPLTAYSLDILSEHTVTLHSVYKTRFESVRNDAEVQTFEYVDSTQRTRWVNNKEPAIQKALYHKLIVCTNNYHPECKTSAVQLPRIARANSTWEREQLLAASRSLLLK